MTTTPAHIEALEERNRRHFVEGMRPLFRQAIQQHEALADQQFPHLHTSLRAEFASQVLDRAIEESLIQARVWLRDFKPEAYQVGSEEEQP